MSPFAQASSKLLTIAAGTLGAIVCYALLTLAAHTMHLTHGATAVIAVDLVSANAGALAAAALVAFWPADRRHAIFEAFTTWAVATIILMFIVAPDLPASHHLAVLQAAR